jgi:Fe-S-cluster containining protein
MSEESLSSRLPVLYDELARDIAAAAPVCEVSGRCCRFREYGHTLFLSRPEAELLLESGLPDGTVVDDASCPFQIGGLCTARERRPLGCRIYFCDPRYAETGTELSERYIRRLKDLHDAEGAAWEYRPLHDFLREVRCGIENFPSDPPSQLG